MQRDEQNITYERGRAASAEHEGPDADSAYAELTAVNERLLLAGLREQERAELAQHRADVLALQADALARQALYDDLTDLPNRALFRDRLVHAIRLAHREHATLAVILLDLNGFKDINHRWGHAAGDEVLRQVAVRLSGAFRESDTVARIGGDEFALLLPAISDEQGVIRTAFRIEQALEQPFLVLDTLVWVTTSIGVACYPEHGADHDALLRHADIAMYTAKRTQRGHVAAQHPEVARGQPPQPTGEESRKRAPVLADNVSADQMSLEGLSRAAGPTSDAARQDLATINEQLLIAGLRQHELASQLGHQLALTAAITGSLGEGVYASDLAGRITFVNPAAERLLGWPEEELLGQDAHEVLHVRCAAATNPTATKRCPMVDVARTSVVYRNDDALFRGRDGAALPVVSCSAPVVVAGRVTGVVVAFVDMTENKHAERARTALTTQLEKALAFRNQFLSMTTHELRTPLAGIKGYAQLLGKRHYREDEAKMIAALRLIVEASDRMTNLIQDLSDAAQIEREGHVLEPAPFDLNAALSETVAEVGVTAADVVLRQRRQGDIAPLGRLSGDEHARPLEGHFTAAGTRHAGKLWVRGDRERIRQVLINLLINAVKYSGTNPVVDVTIRRAEYTAVVTVTDYGIGIPAAEQAAVFNLNFRASNVAANRASGHGLGLFISKRIVEQHAGSLTVESVEGEGSTFTLSLPLVQDARAMTPPSLGHEVNLD